MTISRSAIHSSSIYHLFTKKSLFLVSSLPLLKSALFGTPTQAAFHMGPSWAPAGHSWAPVGPQLDPTGAHLGMLLGHPPLSFITVRCCHLSLNQTLPHQRQQVTLHCHVIVSVHPPSASASASHSTKSMS